MKSIGSYSEIEVWGFTPRKIAALLFVARKREAARDRKMLALHTLAARGAIRDVQKEMKDPEE